MTIGGNLDGRILLSLSRFSPAAYSAFPLPYYTLGRSRLVSPGRGKNPQQSIAQALLGVKGGKQTSPALGS